MAVRRPAASPDFERGSPVPNVPSASAIFLCFNQQDTVAEAFESLLAQTVPLEIIASDDASDDATFARIHDRACGHEGPHAIRLYRQRRNLGIGGNFRFCVERATRRHIALFEDDDRSQPWRIERLLDLAEQHPNARLFGSTLMLEAADGTESIWRYVQVERGEVSLSGDWVVRGACFMIGRELIDRFPPIPRRTVAVDLLLNLRALRHSGLDSRVVSPEPLVRYRRAASGATRGLQAARGWTGLRRRAPRQLGDFVAVLLDDRRTCAA
jgi:glycosyltransferase involved in cell wall biosynthesis